MSKAPQDPLHKLNATMLAILERQNRQLELQKREITMLTIVLNNVLAAERLLRPDGKKWLATLRSATAAGMATSKAKMAPDVAKLADEMFERVEKHAARKLRQSKLH